MWQWLVACALIAVTSTVAANEDNFVDNILTYANQQPMIERAKRSTAKCGELGAKCRGASRCRSKDCGAKKCCEGLECQDPDGKTINFKSKEPEEGVCKGERQKLMDYKNRCTMAGGKCSKATTMCRASWPTCGDCCKGLKCSDDGGGVCETTWTDSDLHVKGKCAKKDEYCQVSGTCRAFSLECVGIICCKGMACKDSDGMVLGHGSGKGGSCQEASSEEIKDRSISASYPDSMGDSSKSEADDYSQELLDKGIHWEDVKAKKE